MPTKNTVLIKIVCLCCKWALIPLIVLVIWFLPNVSSEKDPCMNQTEFQEIKYTFAGGKNVDPHNLKLLKLSNEQLTEISSLYCGMKIVDSIQVILAQRHIKSLKNASLSSSRYSNVLILLSIGMLAIAFTKQK